MFNTIVFSSSASAPSPDQVRPVLQFSADMATFPAAFNRSNGQLCNLQDRLARVQRLLQWQQNTALPNAHRKPPVALWNMDRGVKPCFARSGNRHRRAAKRFK
jgi:hypothetical protein